MQNQCLEFTLLKNMLKNDGRFMARVIHQKTIFFEDLLVEMENNTTQRKEDIRLAITQFMNAIVSNLIRGLKVETPIGIFKTTIRGSFGSIDEDFRPGAETNNHEVKIILKINDEMIQRVTTGINTEKVMENSLKHPLIIGMENLNAPESNFFKAFHAMSLTGVNLKVDTEMEDEGVFWEDSQGTITKTPVITYNTSSLLQLQTPELAPGKYTVSVVARLGNHVLRSTKIEELVTIK
ncbi:MAG: DUF4469 domain-containing protein [Spirochaetales bacterium]|nr:DUF4469 domain-containing protein [Spirochaetales bacterium]